MNKLITILVASSFALAGANVLAADAPKDTSAKTAPAKLEKPAGVTPEAWSKMSDAEKQKAVQKVSAEVPKTAAKKEKKGGC